MTKSPHAFRSIGEVARLIGVATHVLRYWETQFAALSPVKRPDGRRYYRTDDVLLAAGLFEVMREDGMTIRGANRLIAQDKGAGLRARGRTRLGAALGLETADGATTSAGQRTGRRQAARTQAMPAEPVPAAAAPAATAPAARAPRKPHGPAPVEVETLPLFPELTAPLADPAVPRGDARRRARPAAAETVRTIWLARLCATAHALRRRDTPLPDGAGDIARALRAAADPV